jgi:hypothetical protein
MKIDNFSCYLNIMCNADNNNDNKIFERSTGILSDILSYVKEFLEHCT